MLTLWCHPRVYQDKLLHGGPQQGQPELGHLWCSWSERGQTYRKKRERISVTLSATLQEPLTLIQHLALNPNIFRQLYQKQRFKTNNVVKPGLNKLSTSPLYLK